MHKRTIGLAVSCWLVLALLTTTCAPTAREEAPTTPAAPAAPAAQEAAPTPAITEVEISGFVFVPDTITVAAGTTVTWTNQDSAAHTVSSRDKLFDSGNRSRGTTFSYTFNQKGTFEYYCKIHPGMTGKIIVE